MAMASAGDGCVPFTCRFGCAIPYLEDENVFVFEVTMIGPTGGGDNAETEDSGAGGANKEKNRYFTKGLTEFQTSLIECSMRRGSSGRLGGEHW